MKVKDLIAKLQKCDPDKNVQTWDPYSDQPTDKVVISELDGKLMITNTCFGK